MSSKARLCNGCGRWAEQGVWIRDPAWEKGPLWVHGAPECVNGFTIVDPQLAAPKVRD